MWSKEKDVRPGRQDECERVRKCGARVLTLDQIEGVKVQLPHLLSHSTCSICRSLPSLPVSCSTFPNSEVILELRHVQRSLRC